MKRVEAVIKPFKLEDVKDALAEIGIDGMTDILQKMRSVTSRPLVVQANAGLPVLIDGETVFPGTPAEMIAYHDRLIELGVRVIGGCCGTTQDVSVIRIQWGYRVRRRVH